jgi:hypothetical protein
MRSSVWVLATFIVASVALLSFSLAEPEKTAYQIEYKVNCRKCDVMYRDESGNTKEIKAISKEWSYKFKGQQGQFIYVSAIDEENVPVRVSIWKNGHEFSSDESKIANLSARTGTIL